MELIREPFVLDPRDPVRRSRAESCTRDSSWPLPTSPELQLGRRARGGEDGLDAVQRDQLADEQDHERLGGRPAGPEDPLLGPDVCGPRRARARDLPARPGGRRSRVCPRRRDRPRAARADRRAASARAATRAGAEAAAVGDEGVGERDERVEDHRSPSCGALGGRQVEMSRGSRRAPRRSRRADGAAARARPDQAARQRRLPRSSCRCALPRPRRAAPSPRLPPGAGTRSPARCAGSRVRRSRSRGRACPWRARRARRRRGARSTRARPRAPRAGS